MKSLIKKLYPYRRTAEETPVNPILYCYHVESGYYGGLAWGLFMVILAEFFGSYGIITFVVLTLINVIFSILSFLFHASDGDFN